MTECADPQGHTRPQRRTRPHGSRSLSFTSRALNSLILALVSLIGIAAFLYPFFQPQASSATAPGGAAHAQDALLMFVLLVVLSLGAVLSNMVGSGGGLNAKMVATLGVLTAVNAILRVVPGPAGFSAVFALPILAGYCYGPTFGYLLGSLSIAVSAMIGAGIGPWLPYQMFTIGWVGLTSGWLAAIRRIAFVRSHPRAEIALLALWGLFWGMAFGIVMNIWFWPFIFSPAQSELYWQHGMAPLEILKRYTAFYLVTSSWWDAARAIGNALLIAFLGLPVLRLLRRFGRRFTFELRD
jgi:energy-coupling factor transport system substrate-specific component